MPPAGSTSSPSRRKRTRSQTVHPRAGATPAGEDASTARSGGPPKKRSRKSKSPYSLKPRRHSCPHCERSFAQTGDLKRHIRVHTGEKPFSCEICGRAFRRRAHVRDHMVTHSGTKKYACTKCDKRFTRPSALTIHMRSHTGERPFTCKVCQKDFAQKSHLTRHQRTRQCQASAEEQTELTTSGDEESQLPTPEPKRKLRPRTRSPSTPVSECPETPPTVSSATTLSSSRRWKSRAKSNRYPTPASLTLRTSDSEAAVEEGEAKLAPPESGSPGLEGPPQLRSPVFPGPAGPAAAQLEQEAEAGSHSLASESWNGRVTQQPFTLSQTGTLPGLAGLSNSQSRASLGAPPAFAGSGHGFPGNHASMTGSGWSRSHPLATPGFDVGHGPLLGVGSSASVQPQLPLSRRSSLDWSTADAPMHRLQSQAAATTSSPRRLPTDTATIPPGDVSATAPPVMVSPTASYYYPNPEDPIVPSSSSPSPSASDQSITSASTPSAAQSATAPSSRTVTSNGRTSSPAALFARQDISDVIAAAHLLDFSTQPRISEGGKPVDTAASAGMHPGDSVLSHQPRPGPPLQSPGLPETVLSPSSAQSLELLQTPNSAAAASVSVSAPAEQLAASPNPDPRGLEGLPPQPLTSPSLPPTTSSSVIILTNSTECLDSQPVNGLPPAARDPSERDPSPSHIEAQDLQNSNLIELSALPDPHPFPEPVRD